jgi:hypothetical protein
MILALIISTHFLSCGKSKFANDPKWDHTIITAPQHLEALRYPLMGGTGTVFIQDSGFYYDWKASYKWDDTIAVSDKYSNDYPNEIDSINTNRSYFDDAVRSGLLQAYNQISPVEKPLTYWKNRLYFKVRLAISKKKGQDTVLNYYYRWNEDLFH